MTFKKITIGISFEEMGVFSHESTKYAICRINNINIDDNSDSFNSNCYGCDKKFIGGDIVVMEEYGDEPELFHVSCFIEKIEKNIKILEDRIPKEKKKNKLRIEVKEEVKKEIETLRKKFPDFDSVANISYNITNNNSYDKENLGRQKTFKRKFDKCVETNKLGKYICVEVL